MSSSKPAIVFVHGAYHPPSVYELLTSRLREVGFEVVTPRLASLGAGTYDVTVDDDVAAIRNASGALFAAGKKVVVVGHSIGGYFSTIASKDHTVEDRRRRGEAGEGGFAAVVYISSPLPGTHGELPVALCDEKMVLSFKKEPEHRALAMHHFYSCVPPETAESVFASLEPFGAQAVLTPARVVASDLAGFPRTYIVCEKDYIVPLAEQEDIMASTPGMRAVRLPDSGHSPFLTHVDKVVDVIQSVAQEVA